MYSQYLNIEAAAYCIRLISRIVNDACIFSYGMLSVCVCVFVRSVV